jgi:RNA polymerase sigma-70 factor (ECF subfamily)
VTTTDEQLYADYLDGDAAAFERLYTRYREPVYGFLRRSGLAPSDVEDLYQDIWLGIARAGNGFRGGNFRAWLYQVARNRLTDRFRRHQLRPVAEPDQVAELADADPPLERRVAAADCLERLRTALTGLPGDQRDAFLLREEAGLGLADIAAVVGAGIETVKSRLRYALRKLRAELEDCL